MTTTDTLKLYAALHADVPETRPVFGTTRLEIYDNSYGKFKATWIGDYIDVEDSYPLDFEVVPVCRCSALEWACKTRKELDATLPPYIVSRESLDLMTWLTSGASSDSRLIDICRAIHAAKGGGK